MTDSSIFCMSTQIQCDLLPWEIQVDCSLNSKGPKDWFTLITSPYQSFEISEHPFLIPHPSLQFQRQFILQIEKRLFFGENMHYIFSCHPASPSLPPPPSHLTTHSILFTNLQVNFTDYLFSILCNSNNCRHLRLIHIHW